MPTVLVTGASRGLGLEFTRQYANDGWHVHAVARKTDGALDSIPGTLPTPGPLPPGCVFTPRCPLADAHCRSAEPTLDPLEPDHWAACFKAGS